MPVRGEYIPEYSGLTRNIPDLLLRRGPGTHLVLRLVDPEEEKLGDEEVDAEVLVDGVTIRLQASQKAEG